VTRVRIYKDLQLYQIHPNDFFIILASDGLWEFISSDEAASIVNTHFNSLNCEAVCERLERAALETWRSRDLKVDDITVLLVYLKPGS
jgi:serine/threonine protein phosphatase PrpC